MRLRDCVFCVEEFYGYGVGAAGLRPYCSLSILIVARILFSNNNKSFVYFGARFYL